MGGEHDGLGWSTIRNQRSFYVEAESGKDICFDNGARLNEEC